eukprot:scaffold351_cov248-Pinguiococcus_pyrenoidosus.AAC.3
MASFFSRVKASIAKGPEAAAQRERPAGAADPAPPDSGEVGGKHVLEIHAPTDGEGEEALAPTEKTVQFDASTKAADATTTSAVQFVSRRPTPRVSSAFFEAEDSDKLQLSIPRATIREEAGDPKDASLSEEEIFSLIRHNRFKV